LPGVATTPVGTEGFPAGVTALDGAELADVPAELVAVAENVYEVPFVRGAIEQEVAGAITVQVAGLGIAGDAVTV
jgi:hypothetical protein